MGRQQEQDGREVRGERSAQALLEAARDAWARKGFAGASVRDIAQAAGVNPGLVRYHFRSKEGLYAKVIDEGMGQLREALLAAFAQGEDLRGRLHAVVQAYQEYLASSPQVPRLIQRALLDGDAHVLEVVQGHLRPLWQALQMLLPQRETPLGALEDVVMSMFGAMIAPVLYAPLFEALWEEDPLSQEARERRQRHLAAMVEGLVLWLEASQAAPASKA